MLSYYQNDIFFGIAVDSSTDLQTLFVKVSSAILGNETGKYSNYARIKKVT